MSKSQTFSWYLSSTLTFWNEISLWIIPFSVMASIAEKACCQIEDIFDKSSNEETASSKDEPTQAVTISLCSLSSQSCRGSPSPCCGLPSPCRGPPPGRLGPYNITFRSSCLEAA